MYRSISSTRAVFRTVALLLLATLAVVRGFVPPGFMLASAETPAGRYVVVQMCDAHAAPAQVLNLDTGETRPAADLQNSKKRTNGHSSSPCVCAVAHALAAAWVEIATERVSETIETAEPLPIGQHLALASPPPPSTGPPAAI